jgi:hypothetical protein
LVRSVDRQSALNARSERTVIHRPRTLRNYAAGDIAARVLLGENPADIPFEEVAVVKLSANLDAAKKLGRTFPESFLKQCSIIHENGSNRPAGP